LRRLTLRSGFAAASSSLIVKKYVRENCF